jgi:UDP-N-acetylglucosamine 1-carboxyvinyltransferase
MEKTGMEKFSVEHSHALKGVVEIGGSKNAALPIIAAAALCDGECILEGVPRLSDVGTMLSLLSELGCGVTVDGETVVISGAGLTCNTPSSDEAKKIRASFLLAGTLLSRFGKASIPMPGGCSIGLRPVDLHLKGFEALGAVCETEHGIVNITADSLTGCEIYLDFPSVGATENLMLSAVLAGGETVLRNCAAEPEVCDLACFLNAMGAEVEGAGGDKIKIRGVKKLHGCRYRIIPDRIEAGTFMLAAVAAGGKVRLENVRCDHLTALIHKLREMGATITEAESSLVIEKRGRVNNTAIKTMPYPGFPTDMQAQLMAVMTVGKGAGIVNETVFENRFMHAAELNRMGADIRLEGSCAVVRGVRQLTGTAVKATDLRAGAALILSALMAEGTTEIGEIGYIDRGYYRIEDKLKAIGARIERCTLS